MTAHEVRVRHCPRFGSVVPFARDWLVECLSCSDLYLRVESEAEADRCAAAHVARREADRG